MQSKMAAMLADFVVASADLTEGHVLNAARSHHFGSGKLGIVRPCAHCLDRRHSLGKSSTLRDETEVPVVDAQRHRVRISPSRWPGRKCLNCRELA